MIVHHALGTIGFAGRKADLEFARHLLSQRISQKMLDRTIKMLRDIHMLTRTYAGERTGGDIAYGVATGFASGQSGRGQMAKHRRRMLKRNVMHLNVLACSDMYDIMARIFLQHIGDHVQLGRIQASSRKLDAHHVDTFLPLAIDPHLQAGCGKTIAIHAQTLIVL